MLVRTRGYGRAIASDGESRSWLLIKHRDDWAGDVDIAEFAPLSVKSSLDFAEILAQDKPADLANGPTGHRRGECYAAGHRRAGGGAEGRPGRARTGAHAGGRQAQDSRRQGAGDGEDIQECVNPGEEEMTEAS